MAAARSQIICHDASQLRSCHSKYIASPALLYLLDEKNNPYFLTFVFTT
jgi:hypothetical protein